MNILKTILICLTLGFSSAMMISCGGDNNADKTGKEYTSAHICPMHCEGSGSDKAGNCPTCKMAYVKNENYKGDAKAVQDSHDGHNHENHDGHDHGSHEGHNH